MGGWGGLKEGALISQNHSKLLEVKTSEPFFLSDVHITSLFFHAFISSAVQRLPHSHGRSLMCSCIRHQRCVYSGSFT